MEQIKSHDGPVLFVTPHYGAFAAGCLRMSIELNKTKQMNAFYDPPEKNESTVPYEAILSSLGYNFNPIFNDRKGLVQALKELRKGHALTMMPDIYEINAQTMMVPGRDRERFLNSYSALSILILFSKSSL